MFERRLLILIVFGLISFGAATSHAQSWDPLPPLRKGFHLEMGSGVPTQTIVGAGQCLKDFESSVGAEYYAAVVNVTSKTGVSTPSDSNAVPFVDALYQKWSPELDADKHVLIALGLQNRAVAIHPGQDWANVGFERTTIKQTIDTSPFASHARNGDYGRALCALMESVDARLLELKKLVKARKDNVRKGLVAGIKAVDETRASLDRIEDLPRLQKTLAGGLVSARLHFEDGLNSLDHGHVARANQDLSQGQSQLDEMRETIARVPQIIATLEEAEDEVAGAREEVAAAPWADSRGARRVQTTLGDCDARITKARDNLQAGTMADTHQVELCLSQVDRLTERAEFSHRLTHRFIPIALLALLLVILFAWLISRVMKRREAYRVAHRDLETWSQRLGKASERILALEEQFPFYFAMGDQRFAGDTEELDLACADVVNRMFLLYDEATTLGERAENLVENAGPLDAKSLTQASDLLDDTPIRFETGRANEEYRIFLPLTESYEGDARSLMSDLDAAYQEAVNLLQSLEDIVIVADERVTAAARLQDSLVQAIARRDELGFPTGHLQKPAEKVMDAVSRAGRALAQDPRQATSVVDSVMDDLRDLEKIATLGNQAVESVKGPIRQKLEELRIEVDEVRSRGFELREPGFDPDLRLDHGHQQSQAVLDLVASAEEPLAAEVRDGLENGLDELDRQIDASVDARSEVPEDLENEIERLENLRARLEPTQVILQKLHQKHAIDSFQREADNVLQLADALQKCDGLVAEIRGAHTEERYLSALADLDSLKRTLDRGNAFVQEVHTIEEQLQAAIQSARAAKQGVEAQLQVLQPHLSPEKCGVGVELREDLRELANEAEDLLPRFELDKPNWLTLDHSTNKLRSHLRLTLEAVEEELEAYEQALSLEKRLGETARILGDRIKGSTADRPHVATAFQNAGSELTRWKNTLEDPMLAGEAVFAQGQVLVDEFARVRTIFQRELELAGQAHSSIQQAESLISTIGVKNYGYSVSADVSDANSQLALAKNAMKSQKYEEVMDISRETKKLVNAAASAAKSKAARKRRAAQARAAAASSSHSSWSSSSSSSSSYSASSFSSSSSSSSSSWSSSSSSGSSFGSSSSGGSSW